MTTLPPWTFGPFELILHAETHYRNGEDIDRRIAIVGFDNSIELSIHTYLNLHPIQRSNRTYIRSDVEKWLANFYTKVEFLEIEIQRRGLTAHCTSAEFIWYHEVRNNQYHVGGATVPQERELEGIRKAAVWVFGTLFDVADVEVLLETRLAVAPDNSLPPRTPELDRLIDAEFGTIEIAGRIYYTSEALHACDAVLYSELAADIKKRNASESEMNEVSG